MPYGIPHKPIYSINYTTYQAKIFPIESSQKIQLIIDMDAFQFERIFVQVVEEIAAKKGLNGAQLARLAWPHQKSSAAAWRKMRNNHENPKRLNIEEAVLLTQAIGLSMADVCGIVQARMMELSIVSTQKSGSNCIYIDKINPTSTTLSVSEENIGGNYEKVR